MLVCIVLSFLEPVKHTFQTKDGSNILVNKTHSESCSLCHIFNKRTNLTKFESLHFLTSVGSAGQSG